jgi:hypothetical protein
MANERRLKSRYPLELNVRYQTLGAAGPVSGIGQTVNMSSSGMLLSCPRVMPEGTRVKTFIEWPSLLNGTTPLQLITVGTVVRCTSMGVSIVFESYQFRTMGRPRPVNIPTMPVIERSTYREASSEPIALMAKSSN